MVGKFGISASFAVIYVYTAEIFPTVLRQVHAHLPHSHLIHSVSQFGVSESRFIRDLQANRDRSIKYVCKDRRNLGTLNKPATQPKLCYTTSHLWRLRTAGCWPGPGPAETVNRPLPDRVEDAENLDLRYENHCKTAPVPS